MGFINYESVDVENTEGMFMYEWLRGNPDDATGNKKHYSAETIQSVAKIVKELGEIEVSTFVDKLAKNLGLEKNTCRRIIYGLYNQGYLKGRFKSGEILSEVSMKDNGKEFYETFLHYLEESFKDKLTNEIAGTRIDFGFKQRAFDLYAPFSGRDRMSANEKKDQIIKIIKNEPARSKEFIKNGVAYKYLLEMERDGEVKRIKNGRSTIWMLVNNQSN